ncbi:hypothetical protein ASD00_29215 [Ensifer sp. Root31]|uniref:cupin domain-containing protein n=1 Tax=Ensifer sp. Root31 TaxID=1736512 RepID=UPI00070B609F|nr:cupin domain-containing protein [Ensifer sp. Root31]KQU88091.1 hypothetical protein ASD00_29215 [Ensifer sp. Root31]
MSNLSLPVTVRTDNEGKRLASAGNIYRVLASGAETHGRYALLESLVKPGQGAPFHLHEREEEAFFVLEGEMVFFTENERIHAPTGTFLNCPVNSVRGFRNESDKLARILILLAPSGLEEMFEEDGVVLEQTGAFRDTEIKDGRPMSCPVISERFGIVNLTKPIPEPAS